MFRFLPPLCLTLGLHVMDGVGDDFVCVVERPFPGQQDGRAGDGLGVDVPGSAGPVLRHDDDEPRQGQHRALLALRHALVDGVVLGDDLGDHQLAVEATGEDDKRD